MIDSGKVGGVDLLRTRHTGKGGRGVPVIRMGMTTLTVDTEAKRLKVEVATDKPSYRPGEMVTAELKVTDGAGKPVQAEVALSAADEGVLTLIAFKTPDPLATFYAAWGLGVTTASQYERIAHLPEPGEERYATGGDGAGAPEASARGFSPRRTGTRASRPTLTVARR